MSTPAACVIEPVYRKRRKGQSETLKRVNSSSFISFVIDDIKQELLQEMKLQYEAELVKQRSREEVIAEQISIIRYSTKQCLEILNQIIKNQFLYRNLKLIKLLNYIYNKQGFL